MGKHNLSLNFKRRSKNNKVALKKLKRSLKLKELLALDLKRPDLICPGSLKSWPSALKKLPVILKLKLKSQRDVKQKWPSSDVISKKLLSTMNLLFLTSER